MSNHPKNNNLNYLIHPIFTNVNSPFIVSIDYLSYQKLKKSFNVLIDGKPFFDISIKSKEEAYEQIIEMSKNNTNIQ